MYNEKLTKELENIELGHVKMVKFIQRMDLAYAIADVVISRAGVISVSELCLVKKPTILVPSPNVAEDHQTKNAMALVSKQAALMVKDTDAIELLMERALELLIDENQCGILASNIEKLGKPNATIDIANEIEKIG